MCEFNVIIKGKTQFKDVVYAKSQDGNVIVKNVLGETKEFKGVVIVEVDVNSTKLVLASTNA
jgi:predicted RNA-binding protein